MVRKAADRGADRIQPKQAKPSHTSSQTFSTRLVGSMQRRKCDQWLRTNRAALEAYNEHVEAHGVFSDRLRSF